MKASARDVVTPAVVGLFLFIAVSGVALFFHLQSNLFHSAHEWLGLAFAGFGLWHALRYWKNILGYWSKPASKLVMAGAVTLSLLVAGLTMTPGQGGSPRMVLKAMEQSTLSSAAAAMGKTPTEAIALLKSKGIAAEEEQLVVEIAQAAHQPAAAILISLANPSGR